MQVSPSAAIAATLVPGTIHAYMGIVRSGESLSVCKGSVMCECVTPGVQRALIFHGCKDQSRGG